LRRGLDAPISIISIICSDGFLGCVRGAHARFVRFTGIGSAHNVSGRGIAHSVRQRERRLVAVG
jgi:hypothetical protein